MEPDPNSKNGDLTEIEEWELERRLLEIAYYNSYDLLTNKVAYEDISASNQTPGLGPLLAHDPHEGPTREDVKDMIEYFVGFEEYEMCHELQKVLSRL